MKLLRQFAIVIVICFLGEILNRFLGIPIPGNVLGMIILLAGLVTKVIKLSYIEDISEFLLKHLAFFFVPAGVGIISSLDILKGNWTSILAIVFISTVLVTAATGITVQLIKGNR
jgi:holin-like protein